MLKHQAKERKKKPAEHLVMQKTLSGCANILSGRTNPQP